MYIVICEHNVPSSFIDFMHSIRVFNCLSTFSSKPEYTSKFSKLLKLEKSAKPEYPPPPPKFQNPEKTVKMRNYTPPMLNTDRHRWVKHSSASLTIICYIRL